VETTAAVRSSIIDGIEFALLGRLLRGSSRTVALAHLFREGGGEATVSLADGDVITRDIATGHDPRLGNEPHPAYSLSPFVLRRPDIVRFFDVDETERQLALTNFFRSGSEQAETEERLTMQRANALRTVACLSRPIAQAAGVEREDVPPGQFEFTDFAREQLYPKVISGYSAMSEGGKRAASHQFRESEPLGETVKNYRKALKTLRRYEERVQTLLEEYETPEELTQALGHVADRIATAFTKISHSAYVADVYLSHGEPTPDSLVLTVELENGVRRSPQGLFSEANLDPLALLVFVELVRESAEHGQARFLVLDDVLQSVDATFRQKFVEYLLEDFGEWQLIFTTHDRLWLEQLRDLLRRRGRRFADVEIVGWSFQHGPNVRVGGRDPRDAVSASVESGDTITICSASGRVLETVSDRLSSTIPVSVVRRFGDRYTLGDHWPGVLKALRKTEAKEAAEAVDRIVVLRNLVGAHHNEWASALTLTKAIAFAQAVERLIDHVHCGSCHTWVAKQSDTSWACTCGTTSLSRAFS
jgi:hypothetical protein